MIPLPPPVPPQIPAQARVAVGMIDRFSAYLGLPPDAVVAAIRDGTIDELYRARAGRWRPFGWPERKAWR